MRCLNGAVLSAVVGLCCFLLTGCSGESNSDDDQVGPSGAEPTMEELGLRLVPVELDLVGLSQAEMDQVARGSYLVNGGGGCPDCHTDAAGYLAGGREFQVTFFPPDIQGFTSVVTRNLTPEPETGLQLTEAEFTEVIRTGKDVFDSTDADPQRLLFFAWHTYRFMSLADIQAMFAFLRRIPPVRNAVRQTYKPPFPFPPEPFPAIGDGDPINDSENVERGLLIPQFFSVGPAAEAFVATFNANVADLAPDDRAKVGRGSYLVNAIADCSGCHTDGDGDGNFDNGLVPMSVNVNAASYLAGGVDIGVFLGLDGIRSRNLTPDPDTSLALTENEFFDVLEFGADLRRPESSLRVEPHFPVGYHFTRDDLQAIFAYLQVIPAVANPVDILP